MKKENFLAFDIGGTKIASALVMAEGDRYEIIGYRKSPTPMDRQGLVRMILEDAASYRKQHKFSKIGLAMAGQIDAAGEKIVCAPNIPALNDFSLGKMLAQKTKSRIILKNDVRAFALGEDRFGRYRGYDNAVFIAVGTGLGGAIKIAGKFYFGKDNIAGEFGHTVIVADGVKCKCGRRGCWEQYVAGPGVERIYEEMFQEKRGAKDIVEAAVRGEERPRQAMEKASHYFAIGLSNVVNAIDPEVAVIGGSMLKERRLLNLALPFIRQEVLPSAKKLKVVNSSLGDDAFLLGAGLG